MAEHAILFEVRAVEPTPNPNAMKFVLDRPVCEERLSFFNAESAVAHPLANRLFSITGVTSLLLLGDFITVSKTPAARWPVIRKEVVRVLSNPPA